MDLARTMVLGGIAGATIVLGMPIGRLRRPRPALQLWLAALAIGVLVFLVWDVWTHAFDPVDQALAALHSHTGGIGPVLGYAALFFGGTGVGLLTLVHQGFIERLGRARRRGAADGGWSEARRLSLLIAVGIGLHNFGEGLAIGESAAAGAIGLATVLVIGFALHNATEGFGIVAPLAAAQERLSWRQLLGLAAIGGAPTFAGTLVGHSVTNTAMSVLFLTLAAGSILYVIVQLIKVCLRAARPTVMYWGIFAGVVAGFATDMVVSAGGA